MKHGFRKTMQRRFYRTGTFLNPVVRKVMGIDFTTLGGRASATTRTKAFALQATPRTTNRDQ
jgi:hypothetical protein